MLFKYLKWYGAVRSGNRFVIPLIEFHFLTPVVIAFLIGPG